MENEKSNATKPSFMEWHAEPVTDPTGTLTPDEIAYCQWLIEDEMYAELLAQEAAIEEAEEDEWRRSEYYSSRKSDGYMD